jgi:Tfp pilus assembly protein PilV
VNTSGIAPNQETRLRPAWGLRHFRGRGFSLLEVMIACGIFFTAVFTILSLVSGSLRNARKLRRIEVDAGMVAAQILIRTNRFSEGTESGDFGDVYRDYSWEYECTQVETNGLLQFDISVFKRHNRQPLDSMSIYLFSPDSANLRFGAPGRR